MAGKYRIGRRDFFKQAAGAIGATTQIPHWSPFAEAETATPHPREAAEKISFPRVFTGEQLKMLAFPLGGVGLRKPGPRRARSAARLGDLQSAEQRLFTAIRVSRDLDQSRGCEAHHARSGSAHSAAV